VSQPGRTTSTGVARLAIDVTVCAVEALVQTIRSAARSTSRSTT